MIFRIHKYILAAAALGALEAGFSLGSLSQWNFGGHRSWSLILLASFTMVTNHTVCFGILLLACLGIGVTRAQLEPATSLKVTTLLFCLMGSELVRGVYRIVYFEYELNQHVNLTGPGGNSRSSASAVGS